MTNESETVDTVPTPIDNNSNEPDNQTQQPDSATPPTKEKKPNGSTYYRELLEKERQERERLSKELEQTRSEEMKRNNQWKELYESEKNKREEAEVKVKNISSNVVENLMTREIERAALAAGILPEALEDLGMLDKSMIEVETTSSGRINFHNVTEFVDSIKQKKAYMFRSGKAPNINTNQPGIPTNKELTANDLLELSRKDPKRYNEIMRKKLSLS
jgi:hypothetical protein